MIMCNSVNLGIYFWIILCYTKWVIQIYGLLAQLVEQLTLGNTLGACYSNITMKIEQKR